MAGDQVYFKCANSQEWHGPATVLGQDRRQVLVKSGITYIRVHPCRLQLIARCHSTGSSTLKNDNSNSQLPRQQQNLIHRTKKQRISQTHLTQKSKISVVTEKHKQTELKQAQTTTL